MEAVIQFLIVGKFCLEKIKDITQCAADWLQADRL